MLEGSTMDELKKPEFGTQAGGMVDQHCLPRDLEIELRDYLKEGKISGDAADRYMASCGRFGQKISIEIERPTPGGVRDQLTELATKAHGLLEAIEAVVADAHCKRSGATIEAIDLAVDSARYSLDEQDDVPDWLAHQLRAGVPRDGLLECTWDAAALLKYACLSAAGQIVVDQRARTKETLGSGLVELLLDAFEQQFNKLPPKDSRAWFAAFTAALGRHYGLVSHAASVKAGIERRKKKRNAVPSSSGTA